METPPGRSSGADVVGDWRVGGAAGNSVTHTMDQVLTKCPHHPKNVPSITSFNAHHSAL